MPFPISNNNNLLSARALFTHSIARSPCGQSSYNNSNNNYSNYSSFDNNYGNRRGIQQKWGHNCSCR